jgi:hypothetical protein
MWNQSHYKQNVVLFLVLFQICWCISNLCRKASQQLNILKRLGPFLSKLKKLTIFYTFILSNFNFCPLAWHFCTDKNTQKIEKMQERALLAVGRRSYPWKIQDVTIPKRIFESFNFNQLFKHVGDILFIILKVSKAIVLILRT